MPSRALNWVAKRFRRNDDTSTSETPVDLSSSSPTLAWNHFTNDDDAHDDASSVWSMETVDDNPGPGRLIDKFLYQRLGKMLERRANRVLGPLLASPFEIGQQLIERQAHFDPFEHESLWQFTGWWFDLDLPDTMSLVRVEESYGLGIMSLLQRLVFGIR